VAKWYKRTKRGGTTYTTYQDGSKPTTWSQSYKDGSTRTTYTHRGGKTTVTKTTKQGGYTKVEKHVANKKQKPIRYKLPTTIKYGKSNYKQFKPIKTKWAKPYRTRNTRGRRGRAVSISFKTLFWFTLFSFSPFIIGVIEEYVSTIYIFFNN